MTDRVSTAPDSAVSKRARTAHPLLDMFPLTVMTFATFMVVFTLMMARLSAGTDLVHPSASTVSLAAGSGGSALSTRASGAGAAVIRPATAEGSSGATSTIVTRASGAAGGHDD